MALLDNGPLIHFTNGMFISVSVALVFGLVPEIVTAWKAPGKEHVLWYALALFVLWFTLLIERLWLTVYRDAGQPTWMYHTDLLPLLIAGRAAAGMLLIASPGTMYEKFPRKRTALMATVVIVASLIVYAEVTQAYDPRAVADWLKVWTPNILLGDGVPSK